MLFNSWEFVLLIISVWVIYYMPFMRRRQPAVLLVGSFLFYAYDSIPLLLLLVSSAFINAYASYGAIYKDNPKVYSTIGVATNLVVLCFFKYSGLLANTFFYADSDLGRFLTRIPLPLGISFYTFSGISLVIDAYRGRTESKSKLLIPFSRHLFNTLLYITFFPKLLAGPIEKSRDFFSEISCKSLSKINWSFVFRCLVVGYFLKMVIADNLKDFTFWMPFRYSCYFGSGSLLTLVFGYSVQMFADFAGYSLIAIGVAAMFGYRLPDNFNFPYISSSFREFWKRWHITLSQFLMEYLYISLGGNRKGKIRTYINLLLTMTLGGLWHGAAWNFLMWGVFHGLCLVVERMLCGKRENCIDFGTSNFSSYLSKVVSMMTVFIMVSFGWLLFKMSFTETVHFVMAIISNFRSGIPFFEMRFLPILVYVIPVALYHFIYLQRNQVWVQQILRYDYVFYGFMLFLIIVNSGSVSQFVYFQF